MNNLMNPEEESRNKSVRWDHQWAAFLASNIKNMNFVEPPRRPGFVNDDPLLWQETTRNMMVLARKNHLKIATNRKNHNAPQELRSEMKGPTKANIDIECGGLYHPVQQIEKRIEDHN